MIQWVRSANSISISQQTLVCSLGQFDKRFSQRSATILALSHDALTERQGLTSCFVCFAARARAVLGLGGKPSAHNVAWRPGIPLCFIRAFDERRTGL